MIIWGVFWVWLIGLVFWFLGFVFFLLYILLFSYTIAHCFCCCFLLVYWQSSVDGKKVQDSLGKLSLFFSFICL